MKRNIKKLSIFSLVGIFLLSAMMCCCFTDIVQAGDSSSSCHQETHEAESSANGEECDCDQSLATAQETTSSKVLLTYASTLDLVRLSSYGYTSVWSDAYQAPPLVYDTSPLYLKYSTLRI